MPKFDAALKLARVWWLMLLLAFAPVGEAYGQLRPLEPVRWSALEPSRKYTLTARLSWLEGQRASLAGATGALVELGELAAYVQLGAVTLEFAGTLQRLFTTSSTYAAPTGGARPAPDGKRQDSGDYRAATVVRLTPVAWRTLGILRFGATLPTTDNRAGLDRDQTDFFALLGAGRSVGDWFLAGEAGVGINGTRVVDYEQSDVLVYNARVGWSAGGLVASLSVVGQNDLRTRHIRGNEDLGEARLNVRVGRSRWIEATVLRGFETFSPDFGIMVGAGLEVGRK